uniref:Pentapeptide repeat-containing protein n=1 Tax=Streptomyces sp. NBC_00049 TaxID=2903617 RepID=A0AAU2JRA4_9ACTN
MVALVFTWVSVGQTGAELRIAEQGQITTRFNTAVSHLGSQSLDLRLGGIYALERIMQDSPRDQPRVIAVLSAYVRTHAPVPADGFAEMDLFEIPPPPDTDVAAATEVLAERPPGKDGRARIDWQEADLRSLRLQSRQGFTKRDLPADLYLPFGFAALRGADLRRAIIVGVDLHGAWCVSANMAGAYLSDVNLKDAKMPFVDLNGAELRQANLRGADLSRATLVGTRLKGADLRKADLRKADLHGADLSSAHLEGANLADADLTGVDLTGAHLDQAKGIPAELLDR